jgi:hypothetical protein
LQEARQKVIESKKKGKKRQKVKKKVKKIRLRRNFVTAWSLETGLQFLKREVC